MNFLFVLNIGFDTGGPSVHLLKSVIGSALSRGHNCHVILKKTTDSKKSGLEELIEVHPSLEFTTIPFTPPKKKSFINRYIEDCRYAIRCKKQYENKKYDAVFLQSCNVGWLFMKGFRKLKCPVLFNIQDIFPQNLMFSGQLPMSRIVYPVFSYLQKLAYTRATRLITISDDMKDTLIEQGIEQEKIDVIYNWSYADNPIIVSDMSDECVFDLKADPEKFNVVYAGNIGKMQNVELIANTAKKYEIDKSIHYYIIGEGANRPQVESIVHDLDNVTLLPMQKAIYAESIYAQADANLIPLAKGGIKTALPSKIATILRTGKNAIFCIDKNSKFEEIIKASDNVRISDNNDPASLYEVICSLRDNACNKRKEEENKEFFSLFSYKNSERYVDIIESMVL